MRLFIDTNVIIDFLSAERGDANVMATELMRLIAKRDIYACFSSTQAIDLQYLLVGKVGSTQARIIMKKLYRLLDVIPTTANDCLFALDTPLANYEYAVLAETAFDARCDFIVTNDLDAYEGSRIDRISPAAFVGGWERRVREKGFAYYRKWGARMDA